MLDLGTAVLTFRYDLKSTYVRKFRVSPRPVKSYSVSQLDRSAAGNMNCRNDCYQWLVTSTATGSRPFGCWVSISLSDFIKHASTLLNLLANCDLVTDERFSVWLQGTTAHCHWVCLHTFYSPGVVWGAVVWVMKIVYKPVLETLICEQTAIGIFTDILLRSHSA